MPYISGLSLQQYVDERGALDAVDVVRIGIQVASGLAAAHAQGLVHRDIKPGNIILENEINRVQITDFGLARAAHDANLTRSGIIAGTPSFMSPEQALSESVDHRSDLFSLGSVMYFAASGQLPFRASTPLGVLQQVCNETPLRPQDANAQIPQQLEAVIEKLLAKSPDERFGSATELQQYLKEYRAHLQQLTIQKAPRRLVTPFARQRRRVFWGRVGKYAAVPLALSVCVVAAVWRPEFVNPPTDLGPWNGGFLSAKKTENRDAASDISMKSSVSATAPLSAETAILEQGILKVEREVAAPQGSSVPERAGFDTRIQQFTADVAGVESLQPGTPADAGNVSPFDMELQHIDDELRLMEQDRLQTPLRF
ncbi:MAG: serine/threonine-protein kinase [Fuerstiella sp.]